MNETTLKAITKAGHDAEFLLNDLSAALKESGAVEGLAILPLIKQAADLENAVKQLAAAATDDAATRPQSIKPGRANAMNERDMQHGYSWRGEDLAGWNMSEKYNGVRVYWDGATLWTREGFARALPDFIKLPAGFPLDGELYDGPDGLSRCCHALRYGRWRPTMRIMVFDAPVAPGTWPERLEAARAVHPHVVETIPARSTAHALDCMDAIQAIGGEGVVLRHPDLDYFPGRTCQMLKLKKRVNLPTGTP